MTKQKLAKPSNDHMVLMNKRIHTNDVHPYGKLVDKIQQIQSIRSNQLIFTSFSGLITPWISP